MGAPNNPPKPQNGLCGVIHRTHKKLHYLGQFVPYCTPFDGGIVRVQWTFLCTEHYAAVCIGTLSTRVTPKCVKCTPKTISLLLLNQVAWGGGLGSDIYDSRGGVPFLQRFL